MDLKNFTSAIAQIAEEKGISSDKVLETVEIAFAAAYKKDYGRKGQIIKAKLDPKTGEVKFWQIKLVVDKDGVYFEEETEKAKAKNKKKDEDKKCLEPDKEKVRFNPEKHIMLEQAKKSKPKIKAGQEIKTALAVREDYGRIAAQTAKQVIIQQIRKAEKDSIFSEYKAKEGEIVSGIVQRVDNNNVFLDIGKTLGILLKEEQAPGEFYRPGQRFKVYILRTEETSKGPAVFLSRAYPKIISKLFELEVPEIASGQVQIKSLAREPGFRSKIAVFANDEKIDPIGSLVGQKGTRVVAVINELGGEKIDIIEWSDQPEKLIANSLAPAKVLEVKILPKNRALCFVAEDQLSLAIGKEGQNVRLAAKLTGWKIDVRKIESNQEDKSEQGDKPRKPKKKKPA